MKIRTTHTGSLPRPDDLVRLMFARGDGVPVDQAAFARSVRAAVESIIRRQIDAGIDVVNDGEVSKQSYVTYVRDRLSGFDGEPKAAVSMILRDLEKFPELAQRIMSDPGRRRRVAAACNGPISVRDDSALKVDIENLQQVAAASGVETFMSSVSPGTIALFFPNSFYASSTEYMFAIAEAMRSEYRVIVEAGFILQVDCPDLPSTRNLQYASMTLEEYRKALQIHVDALNHGLSGLPADRIRMHICWGNYPGPHHFDVDLGDIIDIVFRASPSGLMVEGANPRHAHEWQLFETVRLPAGKILIPGMIECTNNYLEHPDLVAQRILRYARLVGPDNMMAGVDCGFSTSVGMITLDPGVAWLKLAALAEGARRASASL